MHEITNNRLPQDRTREDDLFPGPEDGRVVQLTPPPLYWLQVPEAEEYRVVQPAGAGRTRQFFAILALNGTESDLDALLPPWHNSTPPNHHPHIHN